MGFLSTKSFLFNGSTQYGTAGNVLGFEYNQAFSFSCWAKTSASGSSQILLAKEGDLAARRGYKLYLNSSGLFVVQLINDAASNLLSVNTTATFNDGLWHHFCMTKDTTSAASGITLYVDGSAETTATGSDTLSATLINSNELWIGASDSSGGLLPFAGNIDEVAVYNAVLTADEVLWIYNAGWGNDLKHANAPSNLVSWWRMGEAYVPTTVPDQQGSNDITLVGSPTLQDDGPNPGYTAYYIDPSYESSYTLTPELETSLSYTPRSEFREYAYTPQDGYAAPSGPTVYYKMRAIDSSPPSPPNPPRYITWVVQGAPDFGGTDYPSGEPTPNSFMSPGSAVVVSRWEE
jgi:hypothetical protein